MRELERRCQLRQAHWVVGLALACALGAGASSCARDWNDVERQVQGGAGSSGTDNLGGGAAGVVPSDGGSDTGGSDTGGSAGAPSLFPVTGVLDDFNRSSGLGSQWFHPQTENYVINGERLECTICGFVHPSLWIERFGPNQEVHATLAAFEPATAEISLIVLSQGVGCYDIQISYRPAQQKIGVDTCRPPNVFAPLWDTERTLFVGDRLGGRVLRGNQIEVWVNEEKIATVDASSWEFTSGYIGVTAFNTSGPATTIAWDDFGGGEY